MSTDTGLGDSALPDFDPQTIVDLDLRDELCAGRSPLPGILRAADSLGPDGVLHLRTLFQPSPLFAVLGERGFLHHSQRFADDDWSSWFWSAMTAPRPRPDPLPSVVMPTGSVIADLRSLPAPEPLIYILDRITREAAPFDVILPFDPAPLRLLLADQGWSLTLVETDGDSVQLRVAPLTA